MLKSVSFVKLINLQLYKNPYGNFIIKPLLKKIKIHLEIQ